MKLQINPIIHFMHVQYEKMKLQSTTFTVVQLVHTCEVQGGP